MGTHAWEDRDVQSADGGVMRCRLPVDAEPRRARIGDIAKLPVGDCGRIVEMTPRYAIIEDEQGRKHLQAWGEVSLGFIEPGVDAEPGHPSGWLRDPVESRMHAMYGSDERDFEHILNLALGHFLDLSRSEREAAAKKYRAEFERRTEALAEQEVILDCMDADGPAIKAEAYRLRRARLEREASEREAAEQEVSA